MSDTNYSKVSESFKRVDIIDDDWILDNLSDDDIEIPKDFQLQEEEEEPNELYLNSQGNPAEDPEDVWDDEGLEGIIYQNNVFLVLIGFSSGLNSNLILSFGRIHE
jgi:hypothetical protein